MSSFPSLGRTGNLGNHLFQIAATIGHSLDRGEKFWFPRWRFEREFPLTGCFTDDIPDGPEYDEPHFHYSEIPDLPNLRLSGYFQSERYFLRHAEFIREALTPIARVPRLEGTAAVHVRRGDYLLLPDFHPILPMSYYERAVETLRKAGIRKFMVFSDDLPWCREHFPKSKDIQVIPDMGQMAQFRLSIACDSHVSANSTFSWWTAWLNPNPQKTVIAPSIWFGPGYARFDTKDLIPPGWIRL